MSFLSPAAAALVLAASFIAAAGCQRQETKADSNTTPPHIDYKPTATVRELMDSVIDPSADVLWLGVRSITTASGTEEVRPRNDEEWAQLRRGAVTLGEAANLLMIPGRAVAHPGEKSEAPGIELEPQEIDRLIAADRNAWNARAIVLQEVLGKVIEAIDARDVDAVFDRSAEIQVVCESCHQQYWYPALFSAPPREKAPSKGQ